MKETKETEEHARNADSISSKTDSKRRGVVMEIIEGFSTLRIEAKHQ